MSCGYLIINQLIKINKNKKIVLNNKYNIEKPYNTSNLIKKFKKSTTLYVNSNLIGGKYQYKKDTTVEILEHISFKIDKVRVVTTGRIGYTFNSNYK